MIQRIQSAFLLAATSLLATLFFSPMAENLQESVKFTEVIPLLIFDIITTFVAFTTIFLYKNRMLQIRLSIFNTIMLLAFQGWIIYLFAIRPENTIFTINSVFPIIAAILTWLAIRYIGRDEALVKSVNRLRK